MYKSGDAARAVTPLAHAQRALDPPRAHAAEQRDLQFGVDRRLGPANHLSALKLAIFRGIIRAKPSFRGLATRRESSNVCVSLGW